MGCGEATAVRLMLAATGFVYDREVGIVAATGCNTVYTSTYPYNPYPFPWVNHLFQDSPSIAIGLFEAHMRKMTDNFVAVRRAELLAAGAADFLVKPFDIHQLLAIIGRYLH